jgi:serine/threonine-protein kinase
MSTAASPRPAVSSADRALAELVEQFLARLQAGEAIEASAFAAQHPEHAEALKELLPALEMMAALSASNAEAKRRADSPPELSSELGILGDYCILREVGRGGMGVVYEAKQISLNRRVALKVLPFAAAMDPRQLQRFHNEAQAAAGLHHTNIVPVFSVGCERGVHYYAMQFIEGQSIASVILDLRRMEGMAGEAAANGEPSQLARDLAGAPTAKAVEQPQVQKVTTDARAVSTSTRTRAFYNTVARLGIQAAEALEYAHGIGVVHRDIKPANLLLDTRGNLWITDFGLARLQDGVGLTMTGDVVGTLRYMSPEHALGKRAAIDDRRSSRRLFAGRHSLRAFDSAPGVQRDRSSGPSASDCIRGPARPPAPQPGRAARAGNDRAQGHGQGPGIAIFNRAGAGRRPAPVP